MASESGKVVKRDSKLQDSLELKPFPWLHFKDKDLVFPDNPRKSIVLSRFHDDDELKTGISQAPQFSKKLQPPITPLLPVDLTKDYLASQEELMVRKRRRLLDEDEAMALELADLVGGHPETNTKWKTGNNESEEEFKNEKNEFVNKENIEKKLEVENVNVYIDTNHELKMKDSVLSESKENIDEKKLKIELNDNILNENNNKEKIIKENKNDIDYEKDFQLKKEEIRREAYEEGYLEAKKVLFAEIEELKNQQNQSLKLELAKIANLRSETLSAGKDLFIDIVKLSCQNILRKELSIDDKSLHNLFMKVIEGIHTKENIKIEMNSEDLKKFEDTNDSQENMSNISFLENNNLKVGDFKIDFNNESMRFNLQKLIDSFVEQFRDDLFKSNRQDGEGNS